VFHPSGSSVGRGIIALADQLVASATNFLTGVIVGRACTQQEFGLYMLGLSIVLLATRLQIALISTPYMVFSPRLSSHSRADYTGSTLIHQVGISVISGSFLVAAGFVFSFGVGPQGMAQVAWALALTIAFILLREYARNVCFSHLNFATAFFLDLCVSIVQIGGLLFLASRGSLSASAAYLVIGIACGCSVSAWLFWMRDSLSPRLNRVITDFRKNWDFGKWIFASGVLWEASVYLYPWILAYFHGTASTGVWAACFGVAAIGNPVLLGMSNFIGPKIAHSYAEGGTKSLRRFVLSSCKKFLLLVIPFSVALLLFGDQLVVLFYGDKYEGYGLVVALLGINLLTVPVGFVLSRALFAMERAAADFATNIVPFLVLLGLGIWLVKTFSTVGVALGLLVGNLAVLVAKFLVYFSLKRSDNRNSNR